MHSVVVPVAIITQFGQSLDSLNCTLQIPTLGVPCVLPVSDGKLEPHVPDHMIAETGSQGNPVLKGVHCHGQNQTCGGGGGNAAHDIKVG